jgi:hypothetical protein
MTIKSYSFDGSVYFNAKDLIAFIDECVEKAPDTTGIGPCDILMSLSEVLEGLRNKTESNHAKSPGLSENPQNN